MPGFLTGPHPRAFAHRGGGEVAPENTAAAFRNAVEIGFEYLETDVHLTADNRIVAFHDETLDRVTDRTGKISDLPWSEIASARLGGEHRIPLLEELFDEFPTTRFNIDAKDDRVVGPLATLLQQRREVDRVCVASFSDARLAELARRLGPDLCQALGPRQIAKLTAAAMGAPVGGITGQCAQVPTSAKGKRIVDQRFVEEAHERDIEVHVWTVDGVGEMHHLLDLGVDGIMTDQPEVLRDVLVERGEWHGTAT